MNPNYPQSDDFQGRPRHYDDDEREYRAGQGRFWDEGQQRGRDEQQYQQGNQRRGQWGGREEPWGRGQQQWGREQPWNRERQQQWGEPSQGEQWGREPQQYGGERGRYQQDYQRGGRQRYQPYASEQYGQQYDQPYGQPYSQQYGQGYDRSRQPYGPSYEESYIGAYPSNASEAWRGEGGWRRPEQQHSERWHQGNWDELYGRRPDQYGQQHGQQGQQYGMAQARAQQQDYYQQSFRGRGPKGYSRSDERIKEDICERLSQDPRIDASEVSVECRSGVVMLEGSVEDRATKHRVEDLVDACGGVKDIQNHLTISAGGRDTGEQQAAGSAKTAAAAGSTKKQ